MDQELAKRRQLENKIKELEEKTAEKPQETVDFDFDDAETKYMEAVLDGETNKAKQIRAEIRAMERQQMQMELRTVYAADISADSVADTTRSSCERGDRSASVLGSE